MSVLRVIKGECAATRYALTMDLLIGRLPDCGLILEHDTVSRHHARIVHQEGSYYIEDLGSCNGTLVNGQPVTNRLELSEGDTITIVDYQFRCELTAPSASSTALLE